MFEDERMRVLRDPNHADAFQILVDDEHRRFGTVAVD